MRLIDTIIPGFNSRIKVYLCDDHPVFLAGLFAILSKHHEDLEIVGTGKDGQDVIDFIEDGGQCDVVVIDLNMPKNGIDTMNYICRNELIENKPKFVVCSMHDNMTMLRKAMKRAKGFFSKRDDIEDMAWGIIHVFNGERYFSRYVRDEHTVLRMGHYSINHKKMYAKNSLEYAMTDREKSIMRLVAEGYTSEQIGGFLGTKKGTVSSQRSNTYKKARAKNTSNMMVHFVKSGIYDSYRMPVKAKGKKRAGDKYVEEGGRMDFKDFIANVDSEQ